MSPAAVMFAFAPPLGTVAANVSFVTPQAPESCAAARQHLPPPGLTLKEGRLIPKLRQMAALAEPAWALENAAKNFLLANPALGNAYADLSVTGRRAYDRFQILHDKGLLNEGMLVSRLMADAELTGLPAMRLFTASREALDRAYRVAQQLHYGNAPEAPHPRWPARGSLGWIAVSGEDDQPYRPVNVSSAEFPQYDIELLVDGHRVRSRYMIAESLNDAEPAPTMGSRELPRPQKPRLSADARILFFIPGMDSRVEEALSLFYALREIGRRTGENWTIITVDMPSSGYAEKLDHRAISPLSALGTPRKIGGFNARGQQNVPVLDFMEKFFVSFVDEMDRELGVKDRTEAVIGGSFGGSMTLRLGRRHDLPWLKNLVSWSPASIWTGLADGADLFKQLGVTTSWRRAGGDMKTLDETADRRDEFMFESFDAEVKIGPFSIVPAQPDQWYRKGWACFESAKRATRIERQEIYDRNFRLWHWRLGAEQLIFSHQKPPGRKIPRYLDNHVRMLFAAGKQDDFNFTGIYSASRKTARRMVRTPGRALLVGDTGHSIHSERPNFFAAEIVRFLRER